MKINMTVALVLMMFLGGCAGSLTTSTEPQQTIYTLRPVAATGVTSSASARILEIAVPSLPPGMDRDRIALFLQDGLKIDYYASARWSSNLEDVIQDVTRRSAGAVLPYVVAVTSNQDIGADYKLQMKINEFQPVYDVDSKAAPVLKASVEFTLIRLPEDRVISSFTLSKQAVPAENKLDMITLGLEGLLQDILREAFLKIDPKIRSGT